MSKKNSEKSNYEKPQLNEHGTLPDLTMAKMGTANDGTGKPRTKATGAPA